MQPGPEVRPAKLTVIEFETEEGFRQGITLYYKKQPSGFLETPGHYSIIVPKDAVQDLEEHLKRKGIGFKVRPMRSMGELPPEKAAALRAQRGKLLASQSLEERKKLLARLKSQRSE